MHVIKYFALLGMASDASDQEFDPRYGDDDTPQKIFTNITRHLLTRDSLSAYVLHGAGIGLLQRLPGLPSRVPDWSSPFVNTVFGAVAKTAQYRASGEESEIHHSKSAGSVTVSSIVDTISTLADPKPLKSGILA